MPRSTKNPRDLTGRQAELLAAKHAQELKARNEELSTITPVDLGGEWSDTPVEYRPVPQEVLNEEGDGYDFIEVEDPLVTIRVNSDLEDVTIGQGNTVSFYVGTPYKVPQAWRDHLEEKGYIYH